MASTLNSTPAANSSGNATNSSQNSGRPSLRSSANSKADGRRQSGSPGDAGQRYVRRRLPQRPPSPSPPPPSALRPTPFASSTISFPAPSTLGTEPHGLFLPAPLLLAEWAYSVHVPLELASSQCGLAWQCALENQLHASDCRAFSHLLLWFHPYSLYSANLLVFLRIDAPTPTRHGPKGRTPSPNALHTPHRTATWPKSSPVPPVRARRSPTLPITMRMIDWCSCLPVSL